MHETQTDYKSAQSPLMFTLAEPLSIRLYLDSRPNCMETAMLHKGLVLMANNRELIQEGMGFGVPVVKYNDKTYFSSSSRTTVYQTQNVIIKRQFLLDCVSKKSVAHKYINDRIYHALHQRFSSLYLAYPKLSTLFTGLMELRSVLGVQTELLRVSPRGTVTVVYCLKPLEINISVDFKEITQEGAEELLVLNEQGSIFNRYSDSRGLALADAGIGGWGKVLANVASLYCPEYGIKFSVRKSAPAQLYRGYEATKRRFSWSGLSYSLPKNTDRFNYSILFDINKR